MEGVTKEVGWKITPLSHPAMVSTCTCVSLAINNYYRSKDCAHESEIHDSCITIDNIDYVIIYGITESVMYECFSFPSIIVMCSG